MTRNSRLNLAIGLTVALGALAGCAGKIRYPSLYVLNVPIPLSGAARPAATLGSMAAREFDAPAFLQNGAIGYLESPE